jgi:hypothetical protein
MKTTIFQEKSEYHFLHLARSEGLAGTRSRIESDILMQPLGNGKGVLLVEVAAVIDRTLTVRVMSSPNEMSQCANDCIP